MSGKGKCEVCPPGSNCPGPQFKMIPDDDHFDGTDGAHPAWWRGYDAGCEGAGMDVERILSNPTRYMREAGEHVRPWARARITVATMAINDGCLRAELTERDVTIAELRRELAEAKRALTLFAERERREGRI